jgi:peptidoglycan/LPS O-acetylase OafA/YrhL
MSGAMLASLAVILASSFARSDILIVIALGLLVLCMAGLGRDSRGEAGWGILSSRLLVYLGEISFAIYMVYVPWKWLWLKGVNALLGTDHQPLTFVWWLAGLLALVPVSMLAHHMVERPFRHVLRNWGDVMRYKLAYVLAK